MNDFETLDKKRSQNITEQIPKLTLNNGYEMPMVGLGTFYGAKGSFKEATAEAAVEFALECGYRHIDCAWIYHNERAVGRAIRKCINRGLVTRQDLFITSKLSFQHHAVTEVLPAFLESLTDLGLDNLDLYLIHSPFAIHKLPDREATMPDPPPLNQDSDLVAIWKILESQVKEGRVRSLGVSNFNARQVQTILDNCSLKPVTNQCEVHLYLQNERLRAYCEERNVCMTAYTPLGQPMSHIKPDWKSPLGEPVVNLLALKYGKTAAQIALKYQIQRGIAVIPKSTDPNRIRENIQLFDFVLSEEDMDAMRKLDCGRRAYTYDRFKEHKNYPLNDEF